MRVFLVVVVYILMVVVGCCVLLSNISGWLWVVMDGLNVVVGCGGSL